MPYQIGDFSRISRLSIKTLRFYHENGLLEPCFVDKDSGYRYYEEKALEKVRIIQELKALDFPLKEIQEILHCCQDDSELLDYLKRKSNEINENLQKYQAIQAKLEFYIRNARQQIPSNLFEKTLKSNQEIVVKQILDTMIASIRFRGKYADITQYIEKLYSICGRNMEGPPMALYYDEGFQDDDTDVEVGLPVKKPVETDEIHTRVLAGGRALSIIHSGPYELLGESYKVIVDYANCYHMKIQIPCREIYHKGPGMIIPRNPKKYLTEILIQTVPNS